MLTVAVGVPLILGIEKGAEKSGYLVKDASGHLQKAEVELLFGNLGLIAAATHGGGRIDPRRRTGRTQKGWASERSGFETPHGSASCKVCACRFGGFRGPGQRFQPACCEAFSNARVEEFSFAMAVIITPAASAREVWRLVQSPARNRRCGRNVEPVRSQPLGHGLCFPGRSAGSQVAFPLARGRPLAFLRHLLPAGRGRGLHAPLPGLLTPPPR